MQALLSVDFLIDALQDEFERKDAARDGQIASLNQIILERDVKIASLNQVMAERDVQIAERDVQINAIMSSRSWKLTAPLRWIGERLRIIRGQMNRTQK